jgi:hypothetical protein
MGDKMSQFELSLNDSVKVRLSEHAKGTLHAKHVLSGNPRPWFPKKEDSNGYSEWLLWDLMAEFGMFMKMGSGPVMFEGPILVQK